MDLISESARRRTFAIISHPDAGKTTLTEKLLLYSGAIGQAGSVRPKKTGLRATSDWMAMEQARGISITSTALQFEYDGCLLNLLDTPGHEDFSEDTYRTLTAVDSAVMVLDAAKGIETQTRKLFQVCCARKIPILTFINKMDQAVRDPLELLDEIESVLGIRPTPMNWPIGDGADFRGVFDFASRRLLRYGRKTGGQQKAEVWETGIDDPAFSGHVQDEGHVIVLAEHAVEAEQLAAGRRHRLPRRRLAIGTRIHHRLDRLRRIPAHQHEHWHLVSLSSLVAIHECRTRQLRPGSSQAAQVCR
jgi:peptide chain release factor 3